MTFADFLYQAGFWQWCGLLMLAAILSQWRLAETVTKRNKGTNGTIRENKP